MCVNNRGGWFSDPAGFSNAGSVCPKARATDALLRCGADPNASGFELDQSGSAEDDTGGVGEREAEEGHAGYVKKRRLPPPIFLALMFEQDNDSPGP